MSDTRRVAVSLTRVAVAILWVAGSAIVSNVQADEPGLATNREAADAHFRFKHHFIDRQMPPGKSWGQTGLADLDRDGDLDFVTGLRGGNVYWYEFQRPDEWIRHELGTKSPSDVGGILLDVDQDGWPDHVVGGVWYRNPQSPRTLPFQRHVFDADLAKVHDVITGDIDGDGRGDILTMSDQNDLRWYKLAGIPADRWTSTRIFDPTHSGICVGDLDGDGDLDVVRSNVWLENQDSGRTWTPHMLTEPWGDRSFPFSHNATQIQIADFNGDGRPDIVIADGEIRGARIGWLPAPEDPHHDRWPLHYLPTQDNAQRGPYHSLQVGDFDLDGDLDIFTVEMEHIGGERPPRWFIWENTDGKGAFRERVILDANLGGHVAKVGDVDGDGDLDICSKPWSPAKTNSNGGRGHADFLENLAVSR